MSPSCILWQNDRKTVVLLDLPRSIEEAQVPSSELAATAARKKQLRRLVSAPPPQSPFPTPEPKSAGGPGRPELSPSAQVAELMTRAAVESALDEIRTSYSGPWCLPRLCHPQSRPSSNPNSDPNPDQNNSNPSPPKESSPSSSSDNQHHLPPRSHPLHGTIAARRGALLAAAPRFDLIVLDPPWPNRSARRKRERERDRSSSSSSYRPAADVAAVRALLSQVPVAASLAAGGLVAVWVTNDGGRGASALAGRGGVFDEWGVEPVGEWTWLKVTAGGEPVVGLESRWRRPWERLLIARKKGPPEASAGPVQGKVIVAVPDVHSRKPNLRCLFEELLPERYEALEVFARNLTAGWWAWGDEVLLFQRREYWVDAEDDHGGGGGVGRDTSEVSSLVS